MFVHFEDVRGKSLTCKQNSMENFQMVKQSCDLCDTRVNELLLVANFLLTLSVLCINCMRKPVRKCAGILADSKYTRSFILFASYSRIYVTEQQLIESRKKEKAKLEIFSCCTPEQEYLHCVYSKTVVNLIDDDFDELSIFSFSMTMKYDDDVVQSRYFPFQKNRFTENKAGEGAEILIFSPFIIDFIDKFFFLCVMKDDNTNQEKLTVSVYD